MERVAVTADGSLTLADDQCSGCRTGEEETEEKRA